MTAYGGMIAILDINESIEAISARNTDNLPNLVDCKVINLLTQYRAWLISEMKSTTLKVIEHED